MLAGMTISTNLASRRRLEQNACDLERSRQAAEAANEAKSRFLAMMSHELRTPLNGILGMAHALSAADLPAPQGDYVRTVIRSGDSLLAVLNDILDHSKIEAGKLEVALAPFDLPELAEQACDLWREGARAKGLLLDLDVAPACRSG